jgi:molecular chaperone GrpE (heat shock protein)
VYDAEQVKLARRALETAQNIQADVDAINQRFERQRATRRANTLSNVIGELHHACEDLMAYSELPGVRGERLDDARRWIALLETTIEEIDGDWQAEMGQIDAATGAIVRRASGT